MDNMKWNIFRFDYDSNRIFIRTLEAISVHARKTSATGADEARRERRKEKERKKKSKRIYKVDGIWSWRCWCCVVATDRIRQNKITTKRSRQTSCTSFLLTVQCTKAFEISSCTLTLSLWALVSLRSFAITSFVKLFRMVFYLSCSPVWTLRFPLRIRSIPRVFNEVVRAMNACIDNKHLSNISEITCSSVSKNVLSPSQRKTKQKLNKSRHAI